jgi:hypothetical protein
MKCKNFKIGNIVVVVGIPAFPTRFSKKFMCCFLVPFYDLGLELYLDIKIINCQMEKREKCSFIYDASANSTFKISVRNNREKLA